MATIRGPAFIPRFCVGSDPSSASAGIELNATNQAALLPRMTPAQRDVMVNPVDGMLIFVLPGTGMKRRAGLWEGL